MARHRCLIHATAAEVQTNSISNSSSECTICHKVCKTRSALGRHMKAHTEKQTHECTHCRKVVVAHICLLFPHIFNDGLTFRFFYYFRFLTPKLNLGFIFWFILEKNRTSVSSVRKYFTNQYKKFSMNLNF